MQKNTALKLALYTGSLIGALTCLYLLNLGIYVEWSASFPGRPADKMRPWAYLYYGLALASLALSVLLFQKARKQGRSALQPRNGAIDARPNADRE